MLKAPRSLCGLSVSPTLISVAPSTWENTSCALLPTALYGQEETNIQIQWCLEGKHDCSTIEGCLTKIFLARYFSNKSYCFSGQRFMEVPGTQGCGTTLPVTFTDVALTLWNDANCILMPTSIYEEEANNIKVAWCQDNEANCAYLPAGKHYFSIYIPYIQA